MRAGTTGSRGSPGELAPTDRYVEHRCVLWALETSADDPSQPRGQRTAAPCRGDDAQRRFGGG
jgi:hypothetical protein